MRKYVIKISQLGKDVKQSLGLEDIIDTEYPIMKSVKFGQYNYTFSSEPNDGDILFKI